jgi:hypothetical protein
MPLDLRSFAPLLAIVLLVAGTVVLCTGLALAARGANRVWDAVAPDEDEPAASRSRGGTRRRLGAGVSRPVLVTILATALIASIAWLTFTLSRVRELG